MPDLFPGLVSIVAAPYGRFRSFTACVSACCAKEVSVLNSRSRTLADLLSSQGAPLELVPAFHVSPPDPHENERRLSRGVPLFPTQPPLK